MRPLSWLMILLGFFYFWEWRLKFRSHNITKGFRGCSEEVRGLFKYVSRKPLGRGDGDTENVNVPDPSLPSRRREAGAC